MIYLLCKRHRDSTSLYERYVENHIVLNSTKFLNDNCNNTLITKINLIVDKEPAPIENNHQDTSIEKLNNASNLDRNENENIMKTKSCLLKNDFFRKKCCFKKFCNLKRKTSSENVCIVENTHL